jgi:hypothetical protein
LTLSTPCFTTDHIQREISHAPDEVQIGIDTEDGANLEDLELLTTLPYPTQSVGIFSINFSVYVVADAIKSSQDNGTYLKIFQEDTYQVSEHATCCKQHR